MSEILSDWQPVAAIGRGLRKRGNCAARVVLSTAACLGLVGCGPYIASQQLIEAIKGCESAGLKAQPVVNTFTGGVVEVACLPK